MNAVAPGNDGGQQGVTVIGRGPMGRAIAEAYLTEGYRVTVWNRTATKADDLVHRGAHLRRLRRR